VETAGGATGDFGEEYEYEGRAELREEYEDEREKLELRPELDERPGISTLYTHFYFKLSNFFISYNFHILHVHYYY
jgi:hypothetical protein